MRMSDVRGAMGAMSDVKKSGLFPPIVKWSILGFVGFIILILLFSSMKVVPAGHKGVRLTWGAVSSEALSEGLQFKIPIAQQIKIVDVRILKSQTEAAAASKDLQETHSTIALNFFVVPDYVTWVYQKVGENYHVTIIDPAVQEVVKAITAKYTAVDLIAKREEVSSEIKEHLRTRLMQYGLYVKDFSLINFAFSKEFTSAIEAKQRAEQMALKAKNDLLRIEVEAKQTIERAKAEAESLRLQKANISTDLIKLRQIEANIKAIEKWNGALPYYTGGPLPFLAVQEPK